MLHFQRRPPGLGFDPEPPPAAGQAALPPPAARPRLPLAPGAPRFRGERTVLAPPTAPPLGPGRANKASARGGHCGHSGETGTGCHTLRGCDPRRPRPPRTRPPSRVSANAAPAPAGPRDARSGPHLPWEAFRPEPLTHQNFFRSPQKVGTHACHVCICFKTTLPITFCSEPCV